MFIFIYWYVFSFFNFSKYLKFCNFDGDWMFVYESECLVVEVFILGIIY